MTGSTQLNVIVDPQFCFRDIVCVHSSVQPKPRKAVNSSGRAVQNSPQGTPCSLTLQWGAKSMNPNASTGLIGLGRTGMCYDAAFILQF